MQYHRLGKSGLQLSAFSYGSWVTFGRSIDVVPLLTTEVVADINAILDAAPPLE